MTTHTVSVELTFTAPSKADAEQIAREWLDDAQEWAGSGNGQVPERCRIIGEDD